MGEAVAFYLFAGLLVGSSLAILLTTNIVRAAVWLLGALGAAAGLFLVLSANFVAAVQLIVYAGGVLVLIVFGVMLTSRGAAKGDVPKLRERVVTGIVGGLLFIGLVIVQLAGPWPAVAPSTATPGIRAIGGELLTTWLVPFELISVLLLAVMIGAAYLARRCALRDNCVFEIGFPHYLVVSTAVFCIGIAVMALKRSAVGILIGVELVLNAAILNFVAAGRYRAGGVNGEIAGVFVIVLAAAEAAIALAIFLNFYANHATIDVDRADELKG